MNNNNDKNLMENMLLLEKGVCALYMHGSLVVSSVAIPKSGST